MTLVAVGVAVAYWSVMLGLARPAFQVLYSGRYMEVAHLLPIVALGSIAWCGSFGSAIALRAMESPSSVFVAFGLATVASVLIGIPATWAFGVSGAIWGTNVSDLLSWMILVWILRRRMAGRSLGIDGLAWWKSSGSQTLPEEFPVE
jgi:O-antigen/teichoic acid export membrane protein